MEWLEIKKRKNQKWAACKRRCQIRSSSVAPETGGNLRHQSLPCPRQSLLLSIERCSIRRSDMENFPRNSFDTLKLSVNEKSIRSFKASFLFLNRKYDERANGPPASSAETMAESAPILPVDRFDGAEIKIFKKTHRLRWSLFFCSSLDRPVYQVNRGIESLEGKMVTRNFLSPVAEEMERERERGRSGEKKEEEEEKRNGWMKRRYLILMDRAACNSIVYIQEGEGEHQREKASVCQRRRRLSDIENENEV